MKMTDFVCGVAAGMAAGAVVGWMVRPTPNCRKTAMGRTLQKMGNAMDSAWDSVTEKLG